MKKKFIVVAEYGLHARPATRLVHEAMNYQSDLMLTAFGRTVNLKSIMGVMSLGIYHGEEIVIEANGNDSDKAIDGLAQFMVSEGLAEPLNE